MALPASRTHLGSPASHWRYEPLMLLAASLATGIACDRYIPCSLVLWWLLAISALATWLFCWLQQRDALASWLLLAAAAGSGGAWHHARWHLVTADHIVARIREESQPICLEARVVSSPRIVPAPPPTPFRAIPVGDRSRCELDLLRVRDGADWESASGSAALTVEGHLVGIPLGDVVRVFAQYQRPAPALNPGEFDFADYERSQRRWCQLSAERPECVAVVQSGTWFSGRRWLDEIRRGGSSQLRRHISGRHAPLAVAVLLGEREYLDADRNELFLVTGTVHLLAISGLNLAILVGVFWLLGRTGLLSRRGTLAAAIIFAVSYALLTDAEPPVLRAAVIITVFCLARWSGRPASTWHVLALSALVVLGMNPAALFQVGAQLSFFAVAVLAWFQPLIAGQRPLDPLDRLIAETRPWFVRAARHAGRTAGNMFLSGAAVWLLTMPLVWYRYHLISPVALGLNPLVALPMSLALYFGFAVLVLGWLFAPLGTVAGVACDYSLGLMEQLIAWAEPLPGGYYWLPAPPGWWIGVFYALLLAMALVPRLRPKQLWCGALPVAWLVIAVVLAMPPAGSRKEPPLAVTFVSVGHGAAVLVELPGGQNLLYDCGRLGSPLSGARPIASVLWSRGITHLDGVVISHADSDHYNALPEILERFSIGAVYVSTVMWDGTSAGPAALRRAIDERAVPLHALQAGDRLRLRNASTTIEVLHPSRGGVFGSDNANSIVLLVEHQGRRALLTGDLEARGLSELMAEPAIDCDLLMAPHHGSTRSNPFGLAQWCRPEHVVISGRQDFELGRDPEVVARAFYQAGANVYHTSQHGAIRFELSAAGVKARPYRDPPASSVDSVYFVATKASQ